MGGLAQARLSSPSLLQAQLEEGLIQRGELDDDLLETEDGGEGSKGDERSVGVSPPSLPIAPSSTMIIHRFIPGQRP